MVQMKHPDSGHDENVDLYGCSDALPNYIEQVTATNVTALGLGPSVAAVNAYLGASMAQQRLFADGVTQYSHGAMTALSLASESARKILDIEA